MLAGVSTPFLVDSQAVREAIIAEGRIQPDRAAAEAQLKRPLQCHVCAAPQRNMPQSGEPNPVGRVITR